MIIFNQYSLFDCNIMNMRFSGHETFIARTFWPKKGYDFLVQGNNFNSIDAVVDLGVGKNMVSSINYWMKALGLYDENTKELTDIAHFLFDEVGRDKYLEDIGSIWLLHYFLVKTEYASIFNLFFNEFRKERSIYNKKHLSNFLKRKFTESSSLPYNQNTIDKDISVLTRLYTQVDYRSITKDYEDEISSLMIELELISFTIEEVIKDEVHKKEKIEWYYFHGDKRDNLPCNILLFSILDNYRGANNISLRRLEVEPNSPGMVFLLTRDALYNKLKEIEGMGYGISVSETAGNIMLVLPEGINKWSILKEYYGS